MRKERMYTSVLGKYVNTQMRIIFASAQASEETKKAVLMGKSANIFSAANSQPGHKNKTVKKLLTGMEF